MLNSFPMSCVTRALLQVLAWLEPGLLSRALLATLCPTHQRRREPCRDAEAGALASCSCPPCILVCTGTGYALVRAFIAHRLTLHIASSVPELLHGNFF